MAPEGAQLEIWGIESYGPTLEQRLRVSATKAEDPVAASLSVLSSIPTDSAAISM